QLFYVGQDHGEPDQTQAFVSYSEATNSWSTLPSTSWMHVGSTPSHGYDHMALDPVHRYFYVRSPYMGTTTYKYQIDNQTWTPIASNNLMSYVQCCGGLDYFPEMNGVIWVQGGEVGNTGGVFLLSDSTGQWSRVGQINTYVMGSYHNFAEYNPVYKVVLFGG